jgi:hypothetical protein
MCLVYAIKSSISDRIYIGQTENFDRRLVAHNTGIVEFEQRGKARADYGTALLTNLSRDLKLRHGKGFSRSNLSRIRQFYLGYPKCAKASHILSWSHYVELLKLATHL